MYETNNHRFEQYDSSKFFPLLVLGAAIAVGIDMATSRKAERSNLESRL